jgi:voltage-gated potassium channel Kch
MLGEIRDHIIICGYGRVGTRVERIFDPRGAVVG